MITIPHPLAVGDQQFTLAMFVTWVLNTSPQFNDNGPGIRQAMRIEMAFAKEPVELSDQDRAALADAAEKPPCAYPIQPARALVPFLIAIRGE